MLFLITRPDFSKAFYKVLNRKFVFLVNKRTLYGFHYFFFFRETICFLIIKRTPFGLSNPFCCFWSLITIKNKPRVLRKKIGNTIVTKQLQIKCYD